jgi:DNA-directed RNA polymerase subunit RPC12/RpoP
MDGDLPQLQIFAKLAALALARDGRVRRCPGQAGSIPLGEIAFMIRFKCPKCEKKLQVDDSKAGGAATCPECGQRFRIPGNQPQPSERPKPSESKSAAPKKPAPSSRKEVAQPTQKTAPRPEESWERQESTPYAVQKDDERDGDPLDRYRPKLKHDANVDLEESDFAFDRDYSSKRKKKREKELARLARTQTIALSVGLVFAGIGLVSLVFFLKWEMLPRIGAGLIAAIGYIAILKIAEKEGTAQVLICMAPFGNIYFALTHWKDLGKALLKFLLMTYIGLLTLGGVFLVGWLITSPAGQ